MTVRRTHHTHHFDSIMLDFCDLLMREAHIDDAHVRAPALLRRVVLFASHAIALADDTVCGARQLMICVPVHVVCALMPRVAALNGAGRTLLCGAAARSGSGRARCAPNVCWHGDARRLATDQDISVRDHVHQGVCARAHTTQSSSQTCRQ
jgi:hypothetical protein